MWQPGTFRVTFADGREPLEVRVGPRAIVNVERRWPGIKPDGSDARPPLEAMYYAVWFAAGKPGKFDDYLDEIEGIEVVEQEPTDPTGPTPGTD